MEELEEIVWKLEKDKLQKELAEALLRIDALIAEKNDWVKKFDVITEGSMKVSRRSREAEEEINTKLLESWAKNSATEASLQSAVTTISTLQLENMTLKQTVKDGETRLKSAQESFGRQLQQVNESFSKANAIQNARLQENSQALEVAIEEGVKLNLKLETLEQMKKDDTKKIESMLQILTAEVEELKNKEKVLEVQRKQILENTITLLKASSKPGKNTKRQMDILVAQLEQMH